MSLIFFLYQENPYRRRGLINYEFLCIYNIITKESIERIYHTYKSSFNLTILIRFHFPQKILQLYFIEIQRY